MRVKTAKEKHLKEKASHEAVANQYCRANVETLISIESPVLLDVEGEDLCDKGRETLPSTTLRAHNMTAVTPLNFENGHCVVG